MGGGVGKKQKTKNETKKTPQNLDALMAQKQRKKRSPSSLLSSVTIHLHRVCPEAGDRVGALSFTERVRGL